MAIRTWMDIPGWFGDGDAAFVSMICRGIKDGVVVEVGSFCGRSTAVMAPICAANRTEFHAVDTWNIPVPDPGRLHAWKWRGDLAKKLRSAAAPHRASNMRHVFRRNMKSLGIWNFIRPHQRDSTKAAPLFADNSVDFCFLDAGHCYAAVAGDLAAWWPKVRPGGILGGHDWCIRSVRVAVFEMAGPLCVRRDRRLRRHACWAIRKPQ